MTWAIRDGSAVDAETCHAVYRDAVHNGTAPLYSAEQAEAWAPTGEPADWLGTRLADGRTWVADLDGEAIGFLTATHAGHLDLFFVRPEWRRRGVSSELYDHMIVWARANRLSKMTTFASHLAKRFLERRGWAVVEMETAIRNGVALDRWKMHLSFSD